MNGRLALGLSVVIAAATYQSAPALEEPGGETVAGRPADDASLPATQPAAPTSVPTPGVSLPTVPERFRTRSASAFDRALWPQRDNTLMSIPAGEFTLQLAQPWSERDPLRQGGNSLIQTLRQTPSMRLEVPLSGSAVFGVGIRPYGPNLGDAATGQAYLRLDLGPGLSLGAGVETSRDARSFGGTRSTFGSSFGVAF
jgi:hypothetical protein